MSYEKFITCIHDRHCNTLHGSIILNGIVVIEESTSRNVKKSQELCAVSRPKELADKWPMFVIGRDVVKLPPSLQLLPVGFITTATYARIWTWMWQTGVYRCKYPELNNTMPVGPECWTWYSKGKRICFYDEQKGEHYETGDELLDFDI